MRESTVGAPSFFKRSRSTAACRGSRPFNRGRQAPIPDVLCRDWILSYQYIITGVLYQVLAVVHQFISLHLLYTSSIATRRHLRWCLSSSCSGGSSPTPGGLNREPKSYREFPNPLLVVVLHRALGLLKWCRCTSGGSSAWSRFESDEIQTLMT